MDEGCLQPFCAQTTDKAPLFVAEAYDNMDKKMKQISLESYRGKMGDFVFLSK